eukprot:2397018-Prymnesium_polylepis.1
MAASLVSYRRSRDARLVWSRHAVRFGCAPFLGRALGAASAHLKPDPSLEMVRVSCTSSSALAAFSAAAASASAFSAAAFSAAALRAASSAATS